MSFYIGNIRIPVVEPNFSYSVRRKTQKIERLDGKPVIIVDNEDLETFSYSSFFPAIYGTYCDTSNILSPTEYVRRFLKIKEGSNIVRVKLPDMRTNKLYVIDDFSYSPEDRLGSIKYTITMTEYVKPVEVENESKIIVMSELLGEFRQVKEVGNQEYIVKVGDCIYDIARRFNMNAPELYADNKAVIGNDPNNLIVGTVLKIRGAHAN